MIMTQFAMMDPGPVGNSLFSRCCRHVARFFGFGNAPDHPRLAPVDTPDAHHRPATPDVTLRAMPMTERPPESIAGMKWRRHAQLRELPASLLDTAERRARQQAVRGLYAACAGDLVDAEARFTDAVAHEDIDLSEIPGFWTLSRGAMMTAVHAYENAGRLRDASALSAQIRTRFRPRVLAPVPGNVTELPSRRVSLSSNS